MIDALEGSNALMKRLVFPAQLTDSRSGASPDLGEKSSFRRVECGYWAEAVGVTDVAAAAAEVQPDAGHEDVARTSPRLIWRRESVALKHSAYFWP
ncbi:unnamed protein product [Heligmosomoides polygyrus]|uniref:Uncharacterized protein n=1 Tax=Heligmosomoides polygyrus TaxID=6339 RepID=A0A183GTH7_HELPZ|nr:unnamed protein product [Heligmosomoides polygyrus]